MKTVYLKGLIALCFLMTSSVILAQQQFSNEIPIPPIIKATDGVIELDMRRMLHKYDPANIVGTDSLNGTGQQGIESWAYNIAGDSSMTTLGPTLIWQTGDSVNIKVNNFLPEPTTTHWHGAELPAQYDGGPHQPIAVDSSWWVHIVDKDSASTMWFHPHYHDRTFEQVQLGLSGLIISEQLVDPIRDVVPYTYGVDDIPVIIGDQQTTNDSSNIVVPYKIVTGKSKRPINLVNGVTKPYLNVPSRFVRLRILNGSTRKAVRFGIFDDNTTTIDSLSMLRPFVLFGVDGGYTIKPDTMTSYMIGPGARAEILVDLTQDTVIGQTLYLRNLNSFLPNSIIGSPNSGPYGNNPNVPGAGDATSGNAFLELRIVDDATAQDTTSVWTPVTSVPAFTSAWTPDIIDTTDIANYRLKTFTRDMTTNSQGQQQGVFHINGTTYEMMTIDDVICVDTKEIWTIHNDTKVAHPFHIHKIFFRVLTAQDSSGNYMDLETLGWNGPKDDILVRPYWTVRFLGAFDDFPNPIQADLAYMYHCHILPHEDSIGGGMMKQFVVTDEYPCTLSLEEEQLAKEMVLYPNPAGDKLMLKGHSEEESNIQIIDIRGNLVKDQILPVFEGDVPLDIRGLSTGFYVIRWNTSDGIISRKLILE